jgi:putative transposase
MRRTYKYRIYPTRSQKSYLENAFSMCRHLFNWNLQERIEAYKEREETISYAFQQNALPALKKERPWFKGVYSLALQDVLRRLDKAYQRFFKQKKGFPKFKKKGQWSSITYPDHRKIPKEGYFRVAKLGDVKIVYHREIPEDAEIKTLSIVKEGGKYFACFSLVLAEQAEPKQKQGKAMGIDLGLNSFVFASDQSFVAAPKFLRDRVRDLKRLQRKLSRTPKRTSQYKKVLLALQKAHYRIRSMRLDFFHKTIHSLLEKADIVVHEDLSIDRMVSKDRRAGSTAPQRRGLRLSIYDAGWGKFLELLQSTAQRLGKIVVAVDPSYTSQDCSECGTRVKKSLSTRTHRCDNCGYVADRDLNAANNILRLGLESLGNHSLEAHTIARSV